MLKTAPGFCVLPAAPPTSHSAQTRTNLPPAKTRWPPAFLPSRKTPTLIEGIIRQVGSRRASCAVSRQRPFGEAPPMPQTQQTTPHRMETRLHVTKAVTPLSRQLLPSVKTTPLQLRTRQLEHPPDGGIPPEESPASYWVKSVPSETTTTTTTPCFVFSSSHLNVGTPTHPHLPCNGTSDLLSDVSLVPVLRHISSALF